MIRVLVVDDHPIFRRGLALSLAEAADIEVCGEGADAGEAVALARALRPDVVLLDLSMPGGGLSALAELRGLCPDMRIGVLTASEDCEDVTASLAGGAQGYLVKGIGAGALVDAVRALARGEGYVAPTLAARLLTEHRHDPPEAEPRRHLLDQLSLREAQVLDLVAAGHSNKEIARATELQEKTVKHHMTRILYKLNARNRTEAALIRRGKDIGPDQTKV